ncbi:site-2 protease family protein [Ilumatobacter sp.]|uniref:site-2 protease family protein n=1 Tax=Ilumatobacter sp. TaxID=1967498 RepID=UPI003B519796
MFRLLGFDVRVQSGFVVFMGLIVVLYGDSFGLWLAGSIAVLTLVHELGHALAARRTGAEAEISLGFLAGYASYRPSRHLSRAEQAWISFAGPLTHIVVAVAVLIAMGVNPLVRSSFASSEASLAIWWAGPAIGLLNLVPVLPLDGGSIVAQGVDRIVPGRAHGYVLRFSIAATLAGAAWMFASGRQGFGIFVAFLLISQFQMLQASRPAPTPLTAWQSAAASLDAGKHARARRTLIAALSHPQPRSGPLEAGIPLDRADEVIELLGDPLPHGDPANEYVLADLLLRTGGHERAAHYAAESYRRQPNTLSALIVARAAGALGDDETAIGWLRTAASVGTSPAALATTIDRARELAELRDHPAVTEIRRSLSPTG